MRILKRPKQTGVRTSKLIFGLVSLLMLGLVVVPVYAAQMVMRDQAISDAIEDEILFDHAVAIGPLDISTHEGIVTLSGTVNNIMAKERAERIAETVKGVRAVVNEIEIKPVHEWSDEEIRKNVENALLADPATDSYEINTRVKDGIVALNGTVESWEEKELTINVAKSVKGVMGITDDITVAYPEERPDLEIKAEIEQALRWDILVDDALIDVKVDRGKV
ncbi:MAG: BON domain-containing protein, partial [Candidatus Omnitrophica bacterium]|nr:BON domain-containing protein [Candidatus Omnitrophota bacterium]